MNIRKTLMVTVAGAAFALAPSAASAQATRTWVSGVGDDANPCSRTAPCKTFAGAISKTATGGEINCLDPGGFGGVTITKSISIVCDYTEGGVLSAGAGVNGIVINIPVTSSVFLSGLDLNGAGNAQNGIRIVSGGSVQIRNSIIRNYRATNGLGMSVQPAGVLSLVVANTTISDNGTGATGGGILIQPTGAGGNARVQLEEVDLFGNANNAVFVNTTGNTSGAGIVVDMEDSQISGSTNGVSLLTPVGTNSAVFNLHDSTVFNNPGNALSVNGANSIIRAGGNTITTNGSTTSIAGGGSILSFGDNRTVGNSFPPAFTPPTQTEN
jgi:hypothetical protein